MPFAERPEAHVGELLLMLLSCVTCSSKIVAICVCIYLYIYFRLNIFYDCVKGQWRMAATVATPVNPTEHESDRCGSEEENRGAEAEESSQQQTGPAATVTHSRLSKLPLARIKALMKTDPDVSLASQESVFIIAKATELFVEMIAKDALVYAQQGKRKTLQRKDLDNAIEAIDEFAFLEGTLD